MIYCVSITTNKNNCTFLFRDGRFVSRPFLSTVSRLQTPVSHLIILSGFPSLVSPCSLHSLVSPSTIPSLVFLSSLISRLLLFVSRLPPLPSLVYRLVSCFSFLALSLSHLLSSYRLLSLVSWLSFLVSRLSYLLSLAYRLVSQVSFQVSCLTSHFLGRYDFQQQLSRKLYCAMT